MTEPERNLGFLERLNMPQRVVLFISGLAALGLIAFPSLTCDSYGIRAIRPQYGRHFMFEWPYIHYCEKVVVDYSKLLGELMVPLVVALLGYFIFKKPTPIAAAATAPAPAPQEQTSSPMSDPTGGAEGA
jgi:hypothetical protein